MRLFRAHGLGNDYLVAADTPPLTPELVRAVCDRHCGVGSDGILEPVPGRDGAAHGLRVHNPDGSEAELSGNGLRIFAFWLVRVGRAPGEGIPFSVWTAGGVVRCEVRDLQVRIAIGRARVGEPRAFEGLTLYPVNVGNPHAVVFEQPEDWRDRGARIERSVPGRTNVQFVTMHGADTIGVRIWERGAGETMSSGSSACAAAAAAVATGRVSSPVRVEMEGGVLGVTVSADGSVELDGPVEAVGEFEVDPRWLLQHSS